MHPCVSTCHAAMVAEVGVVLGTLTYPHLILPYSAYSCIATAEQVSLKGALAAEKRRANKLQRQIERASRSQTAKAGVDASLAGALELQETLEAERGRSRSLERRLEDNHATTRQARRELGVRVDLE